MRIARVTLAFLTLLAGIASAQLPTQEYRGVTETGLLLRKLASTASVLVIGAHPDDEDTQLMSYLSLKDGAAVSYLSLTRGEGGQNSIGGELGPALGVLRTGELLAARKVDRSDQYFTRAYDFGFSRNAEETFQHWPRDSILADVVAIVRRVRPDIIVAIFSGTPRDGHGQHQVSGMLAREAFAAAADPARFPEQIRAGLRPHKAIKLVQATGYRQADPTQILATGVVDPLFGRSYAQLAAVSRSRHRSQDMGQAEAIGPRTTSIRIIASTVSPADSAILRGYPTTLGSRAVAANEKPAVQLALARYDSAIARAQAALSPYSTARVPEFLSTARRELQNAVGIILNEDLRFAARRKLGLLEEAMPQAAGVVVDAIADTELIVPGSTFNVDVTVWNAGHAPLRLLSMTPVLPAGWHAETLYPGATVLAPDSVVTRKFRIQAPADAAISQPYFMTRPRPGDYYAWPTDSDVAGEPFDVAPVRARVELQSGDARFAHIITATRRVVDPRQGELRRALHIAPAFAIMPERATSVITLASLASGARKSIDVAVEVLSNGSGGTVSVSPQLPPGWHAVPQEVSVTLAGTGEAATAKFAIEPPRSVSAGKYEVRFSAVDAAGRSYDLGQRVIDYPHIENRVLYEPAVQNITLIDARFARGMRIGYVIGVDPQVPQVLEQMGALVERLGEPALANAELGVYDAIVIGSRAYEVRPDLATHNARVLDYARKGGNVVVMYQQYEFIQGKFAPFELTLARPHTRITDENSPVTLLDTTAAALARPNRIAERDFVGWVQERALYMPHTWAAEYKPLLEINDPGEGGQRGAILVAPIGSGFYTYTGIAFFRQIPAGVPGAVRLFINLLSMGIKDAAF